MTNNELIEILNRMKSGLISRATGGNMDDDEYEELRKIIINEPKLKKYDISFIKSNMTPNEFFRYIQGMFDHYKERSNYITEKVNTLISALEDSNETIFYQKTGWERIDESVSYLLNDLNTISDRIDINEIGVRCRETIIMLADMVYVDFLHHPSDYPDDISPTDAKRKFDGYFEHQLNGKSNEEKRNYAKSCNKLANYLTHGSNLTMRDAKLGIVATLSLIQLIKIIETDFNN